MTDQSKIAIYPGTFDPLTNGHVSLIKRACEIFDHVLVAVAADTHKAPLFTAEERLEMVRKTFKDEPAVSAEIFEGLLVNFAEEKKAHVIVRGLRAVSDFEYEFQLALMNRKLKRKIQTIFLMTDYQWLYISSTIIKSAASLGGNVKDLVPPYVEARLAERYRLLAEQTGKPGKTALL